MASSPTKFESTESARVTTGRKSRICLLIPILLLFCYVLQCGLFIKSQSLTYDEPLHVIAGLDAWRHGRFELWNDHPPLGRLLLTLPLINNKWQIETTGTQNAISITAVRPDPEALAWRGRAVNVLLGVMLGLLLWYAARRIFSEGAANLVLALFAFSPGLIAHFSVISTDGVGVLMVFATAVQLIRWRHNPSRLQTALMGIVLGLLLLAKFYTPPYFLVALGFMLILKPKHFVFTPRHWNWKAMLSAATIALFVLWAGYFFHVSHLKVQDGVLTATYPNREPLVKKVRWKINFSVPVPAGEFIDGLRSVKFHNHLGHQSFFLGKVSHGAGRLYYPVVILLKWPTIVLLLFAATAMLVLVRQIRFSRDQLIDGVVFALFAILCLVLAVQAKITIGDRHVLPLYPFVLLFTGAIWSYARGLSERRAVARRWFAGLILAAAVLNVADTLRYTPDYLSYFNIFVRPENSYKLLTDSNLDWGQGLLALRKYEARHPDESIHLAYFGSIVPSIYGIGAVPLQEDEKAFGTVVVSATHLSGQYLKDPGSYTWLLKHRPKAILDHSLFVFEVPPAER